MKHNYISDADDYMPSGNDHMPTGNGDGLEKGECKVKDNDKHDNCEQPKVRFYRCSICGQIVASSEELKNPLTCCGQEMTMLKPNTTEASMEHHIPVFHEMRHKVCVEIGKTAHPMTPEHHIEWVCLVTNCGVQWKHLKPDCTPEVSFRIKSCECVKHVYAYCNLHGLWMKCSEE